MKLFKGYTRQEISWMFYDWANSAHSVIVVTILPIFFATVAANTADTVGNMTIWGYATSIAMAIVALLAPVLGVFGDFMGWRKRLFTLFMVVGVLSCVGLAVTPLLPFGTVAQAQTVGLAILVLYVLSTIGFAGANLYYDSFLTDVTSEDRMDRVSTMGYGLGYIGGSTIPLLIFLIMNAVGVPMLTCLSFIFGFTALWWFVFSIPLLRDVRQVTGVTYSKGAVGRAVSGIFATLHEIATQHKKLFVFLIAYFFYIDGVNTIIHMSTSYGSNLGLGSTDMLLALLMVQVLGLPFCLLYIRLSEKWSPGIMIGVGIGIYMFTCVFGFFMRDVWQFWVLALLVATSQGGIQALSRSMFGKLLPDKQRSGEFFGFFEILGKFSAVMGPALVGFVSGVMSDKMMADQGITAATATAAQAEAINAAAAPYGILSILVLFLIGGGLYLFVLPRTPEKS